MIYHPTWPAGLSLRRIREQPIVASLTKSLRRALREDSFALTAQLSIAAASTAADILKQADLLAGHVDAIQVTDNPGGQVHVAPLAVASLLLGGGVDPVLQMTARDRNRVALRSDLLGAATLGVTSLVLMRGDKLPESAHWPAQPVFELTGRELIATAQDLKDDPDLPNVGDLLIGAVAPVFDPAKVWKPKGLHRKADAGAQFIQTQLCFDAELLRRYMARLVATQTLHRLSVVVSTAVLPTANAARWIRDNVRGSPMPDSVIARLEQAPDPEQEGIEICAELLATLGDVPGVSGANIMTPGDLTTIPAAIDTARLAKRQ